ncbi:hypothetical protein Dsin_028709 [Dipteronia sinensis]|uniref:Uncharacterized protein n=1 Tax=Dipteronia sinensis TaxID=43782 RepID=A0AAD9ZQY7_9ROSI|nr:hypothetical protein Dsin_028709 [Dipteronia sinensis]
MASNRGRGRRGRGLGIQPSPTDIFRGIEASDLSSDLSLTYNSPLRPNHRDKYAISIISQPPDPNLLNIPSPSPSPNLSWTNKFSPLQADSPSFKTVVSAHLSPHSIKQEKLAISKQNLNTTSSPSSSKPPSLSYPYIPKSFFDIFCSMEISILLDQYFDEPKKLADTLIDPVFFRLPKDHLKCHMFYEFILVDTNFIYISDVFDKVDKEKIIFRKIKLCKILTQAQWGDPNKKKRFSRQFLIPDFTYWDYIKAWTYMLYGQNPGKSLSWFIYFDKNFPLEIPFWFLEWWDKYGPTIDILPPSIKEGYTYWTTHFDKPST